MFTLYRWPICQMGLLHVTWRQLLVSIYRAKTVIHVKKSTHILQIKITCYKRDVYMLPSFMAHVLQHVHT